MRSFFVTSPALPETVQYLLAHTMTQCGSHDGAIGGTAVMLLPVPEHLMNTALHNTAEETCVSVFRNVVMMTLPEGLIWKEEGRLAYCTLCCSPVAASNDKLIKQHCKSRTHKQSARKAPAEATTDPVDSAIQLKCCSNRVAVAPEDYQPQHLDTLHIAGTYPDDSPYIGLYYTLTDGTAKQQGSQQNTEADAVTATTDGLQELQHCLNCSQINSGNWQHCSASNSSTITQVVCYCTDKAPGSTSTLYTDAPDMQQLQHSFQLCNIHQHQRQQQRQPLPQLPQQKSRPCWPPPFAVKPKAAVTAGQPFLTTVCGSIPWVPGNVDEALQWYCQPGACRLPNIDIGGVNQQVKSWSHAGKLLRGAAAEFQMHPYNCKVADCHTADITVSSAAGAAGAASDSISHGQPFWASLVADMQHPAWWPKTGHVPTYDVVIIGAGPSGIGIHRDVDHGYCTNPPPVATYLTIVKGKKHVILLPPGQTLFPVDDKLPFPPHPTPDLVQSVKAAGGAFFDLQPAPDGSPVTLLMPTGWLHWLVGASDWHVVFGGSCHMVGH